MRIVVRKEKASNRMNLTMKISDFALTGGCFMNEKTCCVTGHRNIPKEQIGYVEHELRLQVQVAIQDGYT